MLRDLGVLVLSLLACWTGRWGGLETWCTEWVCAMVETRRNLRTDCEGTGGGCRNHSSIARHCWVCGRYAAGTVCPSRSAVHKHT